MSDSMGFSMEVPNIEEVRQEVQQVVSVSAAQSAATKTVAETNAVAILNADFSEMATRKKLLTPLEQFGADTMQKSAAKNSLMKSSIDSLSKNGMEGGVVGKGLGDLNTTLKALDPSPIDFTKKGVLGKIFNPIHAYFEKFEKADAVVERCLESLETGKRTLINDNTTLSLEQDNLSKLTKKLAVEIDMAMQMDSAITAQVEEAKMNMTQPADKIRFVEEEVLFPLRQRIMDMQTLTVVNQQGIMAMDLVRRNNRELIRGVERAKMVTVTALRTAVMVASALYNQRIVLEKINAINATTETMITATSKMLKEQGTEIHRQAVQSTISIDTLKSAFNDCIESMDEISNFRVNALPMLTQQISDFRELATKGEVQLQRIADTQKLALEDHES